MWTSRSQSEVILISSCQNNKQNPVRNCNKKHGCMWRHLPWPMCTRSCDNNNSKPLSYFSLAGTGSVDRSSAFYCSSCVQCRSNERWWFAALHRVVSEREWCMNYWAAKTEDHISLSQGKTLYHGHRNKESPTSSVRERKARLGWFSHCS